MMRALGINRATYSEGAAFDKDHQTNLADQRKEENEKRRQMQEGIAEAKRQAMERLRAVEAQAAKDKAQALKEAADGRFLRKTASQADLVLRRTRQDAGRDRRPESP
jgi:hypothetical protein